MVDIREFFTSSNCQKSDFPEKQIKDVAKTESETKKSRLDEQGHEIDNQLVRKRKQVTKDTDIIEVKKHKNQSVKTKCESQNFAKCQEKNLKEFLKNLRNVDLEKQQKEKPNKFSYGGVKTEIVNDETLIKSIIPRTGAFSELIIVFTGILKRMDRNTAEFLAKSFGAKVTKSISKKTGLLVVGDDAGPSKIQKIIDYNIKAIDEDSYIELLKAFSLSLEEQKSENHENIILDSNQQSALKGLNKGSIDTKLSPDKTFVSFNQEKPKSSLNNLWTVKYAPTNTTQLCGNKSNIGKLKLWLSDWFNNQKKNFTEPGSSGYGTYRACLIVGPPGIGKTSAAHIVSKELGFLIFEKNASDIRSKTLLNQFVKTVCSNTCIYGYYTDNDNNVIEKNKKKFCIIMDEVDGMSTGDFGGISALTEFCQTTKMPIILICNDKSAPKMRPFDKVAFDLSFRRPSETEVKSRLMSIAHREQIKLDPSVIGYLVKITFNDIRQMINLLYLSSRQLKIIDYHNTILMKQNLKKKVILKPFEIAVTLLGSQTHSVNSNFKLNDKIDLYFNDIDLTPLLIQENYLLTKPVYNDISHLGKVSASSNLISESDCIESLIRSKDQHWGLLPFHAVMSSVFPSFEICGVIKQRINYTSWLGQNSKQIKYKRLLQRLHSVLNTKLSCNKNDLRLYSFNLLAYKLTNPLITKKKDGINDVISLMSEYNLTKDDWNSIIDFGFGDYNSEILLKKIQAQVKSAFTKSCNSSLNSTKVVSIGISLNKNTFSKDSIDYDDVLKNDNTEPIEKTDLNDFLPTKNVDNFKKKIITKKNTRKKKVVLDV